jgi:hypothetical protein
LTLSLCFTTAFAEEIKGAERFKDIKNTEWHFVYIDKLTKMGAIAGLPNGTFAPAKDISRAEFVKIIVATTIRKQQPGEKHWAENYIKKAEETGLLFPDEFKLDTLNKPIMRQEMAKILSRCMDFVLKEDILLDTTQYTDKITDWATTCKVCKPDIAQCYGKGIITGMLDGSFAGKKATTRAEATTMIVRLIDKSYRYKLVGDIPFTPIVDVAADGRMKIAKAQQYMNQTLDSLEFYKENDKYYVKGSFPQLPEGFENWLKITVVRKNKPMITLTNGFTMIKENVIPKEGSFSSELNDMASTSEIDLVEIQIGITAPNSNTKDDNFEGHYSISTNSPNTIALVDNVAHETRYLNFTVSKLFKW